MPLRILSGKGAVQIMPFWKLGGKCHFLLRFCTRNWSETYNIIFHTIFHTNANKRIGLEQCDRTPLMQLSPSQKMDGLPIWKSNDYHDSSTFAIAQCERIFSQLWLDEPASVVSDSAQWTVPTGSPTSGPLTSASLHRGQHTSHCSCAAHAPSKSGTGNSQNETSKQTNCTLLLAYTKGSFILERKRFFLWSLSLLLSLL